MKKLLASLLCLILLLSMIPMTAMAAEGEGWHYDEATGTLTVTAAVFGAPWGEELKDSVKKVVYEQDPDGNSHVCLCGLYGVGGSGDSRGSQNHLLRCV